MPNADHAAGDPWARLDRSRLPRHVAVIMDGGPALAHMGSLLDAIEAHQEESS